MFKIKKFNFLILTKSSHVIFPLSAFRFFSIPDLTIKHKKNNFYYAILSFLKGIYKFKIYKNKHVIFHHWGYGYYHFIIEILPKLISFHKSLNKNDILLPPNPPKFVIEILTHFQLNNITFYKGTSLILNCTLISNLSSNKVSTKQVNLIKSWANNFTKNKYNFERIYISRKNSRSRKIINENELIRLLIKYNFITFYTEDFSIIDQISIFKNSKVIFAPHGAGITNIIFSQFNTCLIEIQPHLFELIKKDFNNINYCYKKLCYILNFKYVEIQSQIDNIKSYDKTNYYLDLYKVDLLFSRLLN